MLLVGEPTCSTPKKLFYKCHIKIQNFAIFIYATNKHFSTAGTYEKKNNEIGYKQHKINENIKVDKYLSI